MQARVSLESGDVVGVPNKQLDTYKEKENGKIEKKRVWQR